MRDAKRGLTAALHQESRIALDVELSVAPGEILALVAEGARDSVYQMNFQFFPLTKDHV